MADEEKGVRVVQLSCETDFVSRTTDFKASISILMNALGEYKNESVGNSDIEKFLQMKTVGDKREKFMDKSLKDMLKMISSNTQENCDVNNLLKRPTKPGIIIGAYLHDEVDVPAGEPRLGTRAGVAVCEYKGENVSAIKAFANSLAIQVAAMKPMYVSKENVPADIMNTKGKEKGFLEEMVLMEQLYVDTEEKMTVKEAIKSKQKELKAKLQVKEIFFYDCKQ